MGKQWRNNKLLVGGVFYSVEMDTYKNVLIEFSRFKVFLAEIRRRQVAYVSLYLPQYN